MACVAWVHKIGVGRNFGMDNLVVQMAWVHIFTVMIIVIIIAIVIIIITCYFLLLYPIIYCSFTSIILDFNKPKAWIYIFHLN